MYVTTDYNRQVARRCGLLLYVTTEYNRQVERRCGLCM